MCVELVIVDQVLHLERTQHKMESWKKLLKSKENKIEKVKNYAGFKEDSGKRGNFKTESIL